MNDKDIEDQRNNPEYYKDKYQELLFNFSNSYDPPTKGRTNRQNIIEQKEKEKEYDAFMKKTTKERRGVKSEDQLKAKEKEKLTETIKRKKEPKPSKSEKFWEKLESFY